MSTQALFMMKCKNQLALVCPIGAIGSSARPMMAFSGFYENPGPPPSDNALDTVLPHCDGHQNGQQKGYTLHHGFGTCSPGGCQGNTEQVVAQWQCQVTSGVALDMVHQAMPHVLLQCLHFKGAFVCRCRLFCLA